MSAREEDKPFEADVDFLKQREYYSEFGPLRGYFLDWLGAIYWELQGTCGPIEYATRVCVARGIVEKVNTEHLMSSHMMLMKVIKNLFPYDQIKDSTSPALRAILGNQRGKVKPTKYRSLQDHCIKQPSLVSLRYKVLAEAFCSEVKSMVSILKENIQEEHLPSYLNIVDECMEKCREDREALIKCRKLYYLDYPEDQLTSVANYTIKNESTMNKRSDMPKDMEPEYIYKMIVKHTTAIRNDLQAIIIRTKEICSNLEKRKKVYYSEINELLIMNSTIRSFVSEGPFEEITKQISELGQYVEDIFSYTNYFPSDLLEDISKGHTIYKNGYI